MKKFLLVAAGLMVALPFMSPSAARALTVSPTVIEYDVEPGMAAVGSVKLTNEGESTETYYPTVQDFIAGEDGATPQFVGKSDDRSLVDWISFPSESVTLAPAESVYVEYNINIPTEVSPGGYYGGLLFSTSPPVEGDGVGVAGAAGPLILLRVPGEVIEDGEVTRFVVEPSTMTHLPANFTLDFANNGTVHVKPKGFVRITNVFGKTSAVVPINGDGGNVLPASDRTFKTSWQRQEVNEDDSEFVKQWKNFAMGPYTATAIINYGQEENVATATASFWVFPWMIMLAGAGVLLVLLLALLLYNKMIISRAMRARK